jgi:2-C-methyl-D-erythritol 4-phosphate cytidylyltransferase
VSGTVRMGGIDPDSAADIRQRRPVGAILVGTGPDVAGIGLVKDSLLWSLLSGHPLVSWSLRALAAVPRIEEVALVVASGREAAAARLSAEVEPDVIILPGTAGDPLLAGLKVLSARFDLVVVHYGNRPLISASSIDRGITVAEERTGRGAIAAEPARETIKRADGDLVVETPPRGELVLLQSPQIYPCADLIRAYSLFQNSAAALPEGATASPDRVWLAAGLPLVPFYFSGENDREGLSINTDGDLLLAQVSLGEPG